MGTLTRRDLLRQGAAIAAGSAASEFGCARRGEAPATAAPAAAAAPGDAPAPVPASPATPPAASGPGATRALGRTGVPVGLVSLGGEGVLRTHGRYAEAVAVIEAAFAAGVRYCDTAPAYSQSQDYYGRAFAANPGARDRVFLASKTHERSREGSLRLLADSLARLGTDRLDLWQLHDLRDRDDLDGIFARGGAIEAAEAAKQQGRVRFCGITGHTDPAVLIEAMRRYPFDTVLLPVNPADAAALPFLTTVVPEARRRGMGVIGMKVLARGRLLDDGVCTAEEALRWALAQDVDTVIVGCASPAEARADLAAGASFSPLPPGRARAIERAALAAAGRYAWYKRDA